MLKKTICILLLKIKTTTAAVKITQLIKVLVHPNFAFHYFTRSNRIVRGRICGLGHHPPSDGIQEWRKGSSRTDWELKRR